MHEESAEREEDAFLADRVEPPDDDSGPTNTEPWNPDDIRIITKPYSLRHICDMIKDEDVDLAPEFQRSDVWKPPQKTRLIESILLRIPLPSFYFDEDKSGRLIVVDGVQRLNTIYDFARKGVKLTDDLQYLKRLAGTGYVALEPTLKRRFDGTQIFVNVIDPQTPPKVKFDIFRRINTGGTPLAAQEIRHCFSENTSREFLKRCIGLGVFHLATGGAFRRDEHQPDTSRMADRELALRFFAFRREDWKQQYVAAESLDEFLLAMIQRLDRMSTAQLSGELSMFEAAMTNAHRLFGGNAFRRWPAGGRKGPINRSLFESWAVALSEVTWADIARRSDDIVNETRRRMAQDKQYVDSFTIATADLARVELRLKVARDILAGRAA